MFFIVLSLLSRDGQLLTLNTRMSELSLALAIEKWPDAYDPLFET